MLRILLVSAREEAVHALTEGFSPDPGVHLQVVGSGVEALGLVHDNPPQLVVIDCELPDRAPISLVQELLAVNAMVNTALISPLTDGEFHEATEGLGVLARLPLLPEPSDVAQLASRLRQVLGLGGPT